MSALRLLRPHAVRPHLALRYRYLRRHVSTASPPTAPAQTAAPQAALAPSSDKAPSGVFRRYRATLIWSTLSLTLGLLAGSTILHTLAPPPMPAAGTHEDRVLMADLNARIDEEFKVKVLRGKCLGVAKQLKGEEGGWVEVLPSEAGKDKILGGRLVENLQGAKGLGVERVFWDRRDHKLVAVVWFGGGMSGWPGVTHGGLIATALSEKIALANALSNGTGGVGMAGSDASATAAAAIPQRMPGTGNHAKMLAPSVVLPEPAQMSFTYTKPTYANKFHVIRVAPAYTSSASSSSPEDAPAPQQHHPIVGPEWEATLETPDTRTCVRATAKFASSTRLERVEARVASTATRTYAEFRDWLWPSRQKTSQVG